MIIVIISSIIVIIISSSSISISCVFFGKGRMGSALKGSLQISSFVTDLLGTPVNLFYIPKSARAYLFPQRVKMYYFCSCPISVDPMCPQPRFTPSAERSSRGSPSSCWRAVAFRATQVRGIGRQGMGSFRKQPL